MLGFLILGLARYHGRTTTAASRRHSGRDRFSGIRPFIKSYVICLSGGGPKARTPFFYALDPAQDQQRPVFSCTSTSALGHLHHRVERCADLQSQGYVYLRP
jgi:hypothetical protein